ncbi:HlyD family secretion protein [Gilvimarinus polysaccharolyticus]|uniref:HlyD family secretion protein n=1 Tax=Gilvimarinus polysaccharolyticus TaxID=863921 RepID=UPI000673368A|nr:HlyD family efflux transporter periplasmic adaptor subunit [Gilvimarinus polysaccharolyticus]
MRLALCSLLFLLWLPAAAEPLLLTGEVAARNSQMFVAPETDEWIVQIAWMVEEGTRVEPGDAVVQYDSASVAANLEQLEAGLRKVKAESRRNGLVQDLQLREAQHQYDVAFLSLQKAKLNAGIPSELLSQLQYEQYQLALVKAINAEVETRKALEVKKDDVLAEKKRSQVAIAGAQNELRRVQLMLDGMTQNSTRSGTAMYVDHPWTREKIRQGDSVERGFSVLAIPSTDDLHVRAWLNEVDIARVSEEQQVSIGFDARPELKIDGVIERIGKQAEPKNHWGDSGYIDVDIRFVDDVMAAGLLPGMSVLVEIKAEAWQ